MNELWGNTFVLPLRYSDSIWYKFLPYLSFIRCRQVCAQVFKSCQDRKMGLIVTLPVKAADVCWQMFICSLWWGGRRKALEHLQKLNLEPSQRRKPTKQVGWHGLFRCISLLLCLSAYSNSFSWNLFSFLLFHAQKGRLKVFAILQKRSVWMKHRTLRYMFMCVCVCKCLFVCTCVTAPA